MPTPMPGTSGVAGGMQWQVGVGEGGRFRLGENIK